MLNQYCSVAVVYKAHESKESSSSKAINLINKLVIAYFKAYLVDSVGKKGCFLFVVANGSFYSLSCGAIFLGDNMLIKKQ